MVTAVNAMDSDLYARLMLLPGGARLDLLEFLGATPIEEAEIEKLIDDLSNSIAAKRRKRLQKAS